MATQGIGPSIQIDYARLARVREALASFGPEALAAVDEDLREAGSAVAREAAGRVRALATTHRDHDTASGYRTQVRARGIRIIGKGRGGSIIEFAGKRNPSGKTPQGRALIATLGKRYGPPGRLLWQAWDRRSAQVNAAVTATIEGAEHVLQARIDGV